MKNLFFTCVLLLMPVNGFVIAVHTQFKSLSIVTHPFNKPYLDARHHGVTNSIIKGLSELHVPYNINPPIEHVGEVVWVLASPSALAETIELKRQKKINYILAGPNLMVSPSEHNKILTSELIDYVVVPSDEVQLFYKYDEPSIADRLRTWYAGVDHEYWSPGNHTKDIVLIYWKTEPHEFCLQVQNVLRKYGWNTQIIRYTQYNIEQYKSLLNRSLFAVFISRSESQGLALAESWAMNVPVLAWNPQLWQAYGRESSFISSCPYMNDFVGKTFKSIEDLEYLLQNISSIIYTCQPRQWVLHNMTNAISAEMAVNLINTLYK